MVDNFPFTIKPLLANDLEPTRKIRFEPALLNVLNQTRLQCRKICPDIPVEHLDNAFIHSNWERELGYLEAIKFHKKESWSPERLELNLHLQYKLIDFMENLKLKNEGGFIRLFYAHVGNRLGML